MKTLLYCGLLLFVLVAGCSTTPGHRSSNILFNSSKDPVFIPDAVGRTLGLQTVLAVKQKYKVHADPKLAAYVTEIGRGLAQNSSRAGVAWEFTVLDSPELNAFAAPGGFIFITTGLLKKMENEAELASVLGHEIGHVERKHSLKRMQRVMVAQFGMASLLNWIEGDTAQFIAQAGGIAVNLALLRNGREAELESDEIGMRLCRNGGWDPAAMISVQAMLARESGVSGVNPVAEMLASHPPGEHRIVQAQHLLPGFAGGPKTLSQKRYKDAIRGL